MGWKASGATKTKSRATPCVRREWGLHVAGDQASANAGAAMATSIANDPLNTKRLFPVEDPIIIYEVTTAP